MTLKKTLLPLAALLVALCLAPAAQAEVTNLEELKAWSAELKDIDTYRADLVMQMKMGPMSIDMTGKMQGKDDMNRTEITMSLAGQSMKNLSVLDKDRIQWTEVEIMGKKQVMKMDLNELPEDLAEMAKAGQPGGSAGGESMGKMLKEALETEGVAFVGADEVEGVPVYTISMPVPEAQKKAMSNPMVQVKPDKTVVSVRRADGFPILIKTLLEDGGEMLTMSLKNVELGVELDPALFVYTPAEGVEVADLAEVLSGQGAPGAPGAPGGAEPAPAGKVAVGQLAPDFSGKTLDGKEFKLSGLKGKAVLLDFWATWCRPCIQMMPHMIELNEKYAKKGLVLVGISLDDSADAPKGYMAENKGVNWTMLMDASGVGGPISDGYGVRGIPHTVLIDQEGKIVAVGHPAELDEAKIAKLLGQ